MPRLTGFFIWNKVSTFKNTKGQATFEYFILFIIFAFVCFVGMVDLRKDNPDSRFVRIQKHIFDIANKAVGKLIIADRSLEGLIR